MLAQAFGSSWLAAFLSRWDSLQISAAVLDIDAAINSKWSERADHPSELELQTLAHAAGGSRWSWQAHEHLVPWRTCSCPCRAALQDRLQALQLLNELASLSVASMPSTACASSTPKASPVCRAGCRRCSSLRETEREVALARSAADSRGPSAAARSSPCP